MTWAILQVLSYTPSIIYELQTSIAETTKREIWLKEILVYRLNILSTEIPNDLLQR